MSRTLVLLLLFLIATFLSPMRADDEAMESDDAKKEDKPTEEADSTKPDEEIDEDAAILKSASDLLTTVYFPEQPDKKFPIGGDIQVLVGLHNKGKNDYNISYIGASLHSPFDLAYYIQNFSWIQVDASVLAGTEHTFAYTFRPDQRLEPLEFWLSAFVYYNNSETSQEYKSTFFNATIELAERPSDMNFRRIFTYFLAFAAAGLVGYLAYHLSSPTKRSAETGTKDATSGGWGPTTPYTPSNKSRAMGKKRDKKPAAKTAAQADS